MTLGDGKLANRLATRTTHELRFLAGKFGVALPSAVRPPLQLTFQRTMRLHQNEGQIGLPGLCMND